MVSAFQQPLAILATNNKLHVGKEKSECVFKGRNELGKKKLHCEVQDVDMVLELNAALNPQIGLLQY